MRNLKKILALALALVMTLSVMTVANAAFTDSSSIDAKYTEAVDVLSGMGVFKGTGTGATFSPKQEITRAEVAAIIYRIVTGDVTDAQAGIYADYAKFADVNTNAWYAGYVGYCANANLIKGDGKNFYPMTNVTGYQALAMILRAMGYDQNGEFTGSGWEVKVASTAQQRGILVNVNAGTLGVNATRELVAEVLFQAIQKSTVVYTPALGYYTADLAGMNTATTSLGYKTFGLESATSYIVGNAATGEAYTTLGYTTSGTTTVAAYTAANTTSNLKFNFATTLAQFGHQTKVWYNEKATDANGAYTVIYATYDQATNTSVTQTAYANLTAAEKAAYVASSVYHDDFTAAATTIATAPAAYNIVVNNNNGTKALVGIYLTVDRYTAINNYAATKTVSFTTAGAVSQAKVDGFAGLNLGAYVNVIRVIGTAGSDATKTDSFYKYNVSALGTTVGTVSYVDAATSAITLNGTVVGRSYLATTSAAATNVLTVPATWNFGATYMVYTDLLGNYVGAMAMVNTSYLNATYAYFTHDNAAGTIKYFVQGVDVNGTTQTVQLASKTEYDKVVATGVTHVDYNSNMIVAATDTRTSLLLAPSALVSGAYTVEHAINDGSCTYETKVLNNTTGMDTVAALNGADKLVTKETISMGTSSNYFFTNSTKFIFVSGYGTNLTVTVKTGLADLIGDNASYTIPQAAVVAFHQVYSASISTTNYAVDSIIVKALYAPNLVSNLIYIPGTGNYGAGTAPKLGDATNGDKYDAYINGVKATEGIVVADGTTLKQNTFYTYTLANGVYTLTEIASVPNTPVTCNSGTVTHAAGTSTDYVLVNGTQYQIASNAVIVKDLVNTNSNAPTTAAALVESAETNSVTASVEIVNGIITVVYLTSIS